jgi:hypothetical protein
MKIKDVLADKRSELIDEWFKRAISDYPSDTIKFLRRQKDPFANPVGDSYRDGLAGLVDGLIESWDRERLWPHLDRILRVRAVQDFTPSGAVSFVLDLKGAVREVASRELKSGDWASELASLDAEIDGMLMLAFDCYVDCRQRLADIRLKDEQRRVHLLLRRAGMMMEEETAPGEEPTEP